MLENDDTHGRGFIVGQNVLLDGGATNTTL